MIGTSDGTWGSNEEDGGRAQEKWRFEPGMSRVGGIGTVSLIVVHGVSWSSNVGHQMLVIKEVTT